MCLKLQELSWSCCFAAEEAEQRMAVRLSKQHLKVREPSISFFTLTKAGTLAYVLGEVPELTAPNQPNLKI